MSLKLSCRYTGTLTQADKAEASYRVCDDPINGITFYLLVLWGSMVRVLIKQNKLIVCPLSRSRFKDYVGTPFIIEEPWTWTIVKRLEIREVS